jgi:uncharacterized membrane protein
MTDTSDTTTTTFESIATDDQRAADQSTSQREKTATEFFREKFADGDEDEDGPFDSESDSGGS